jgi:hypothetical protein
MWLSHLCLHITRINPSHTPAESKLDKCPVVLQTAKYVPSNHDDELLIRLLMGCVCLLYDYLPMTELPMIADWQVLYDYQWLLELAPC